MARESIAAGRKPKTSRLSKHLGHRGTPNRSKKRILIRRHQRSHRRLLRVVCLPKHEESSESDGLAHLSYPFPPEPPQSKRKPEIGESQSLISIILSSPKIHPLWYGTQDCAAFHEALSHPVCCWDISILLIENTRKSIFSHKLTIATLLDLLLLATMAILHEDWIFLPGHQKAAWKVLQEIQSPDIMVDYETRRLILDWHWAIELFASCVTKDHKFDLRRYLSLKRARWAWHRSETSLQ